MKEPVVTVQSEADNAAKLRPTEAGDPRSTPEPAARFTHASGSTPLAGYVIKRGVGHGGFGEVYFAISDAGKEVAIKLVRRNLEIELRGIRQCLNLNHPNLVSLHDIRRDAQGDSWVVMEYVSGACLQDLMAAHPDGLPIEEALSWFHGIAAGVTYLHDHGIVHRDLKPGNLFSDGGIVKIGDYGLSKFISCSRRSGQTESVGTVHYMAPEVANGRYGKEIDIYALGIILYEILTGHVPFEGESVGEVLMKHLTAQPDVSVLAEPYRGVVARALEKDPAKRFKSVQEMLARLPQPAGGSPLTAKLPSAARVAAPDAARRAAGAVGRDTAPAIELTPVVEVVDEEPILRALRLFCLRMYHAWNESNFNTPTKIVLIVAGTFLLLATAEVLIPLSMALLILYGGYRLVRTLARSADPSQHGSTAASGTGPRPVPATAPEHRARAHRTGSPFERRWVRSREQAAEALICRTPSERVTELVGSLFGGALVSITMCIVFIILNGFRAGGEIPRPEQCAWLGLMSIAGTWAVLITAKFWEGTRGETMPRRFIMMVVGLGLGVLAFAVAQFLLVELSTLVNLSSTAPDYELPAMFYEAEAGKPLLPAFLACFATLFVVVRWWRQADPLRSTRLSLWSMFVCVVCAALVAAVWQFPQPWLPMMAGAMSVSVQLSSPWLHPRRRHAPRHA